MDASTQQLNHEIIDDLFAILGDGYHEIVDDQVSQGKEYLAGIEQELDANHPAEVQRMAHSLKSSAGQIGLQGIYELARDLEKTSAEDAAANRPCSTESRQIYTDINANFAAAVQTLRDYLRK